VSALVDATPAGRSRYVDFLRALSILVVVLWHWVFSVTQWDGGSLSMPNPIREVPGLWLVTWLLQIMPVFFIVGGFANLAGYEGTERKGGGYVAFIRGRLRRLFKPVAVYVGLWAVGDLLARFAVPGYSSVLRWGMVVFVPLWFLGVYTGVSLLAPAMIRLHRRAPWATLGGLVAMIVVGDVLRFVAGREAAGLLTSVAVWVFAHQLGFFWRDGTLTSSRRRAALVAACGLVGLVVLTSIGAYPRSMVSVTGEGSNMFPTTACIAALAVFQLGVVLLLRPVAERWLERRGPWTVTVALNGIAMTVFCWHRTALVAAIGLYELVGGELMRTPSTAWWLHRPLWLVLPGALLAVLVVVFRRFEQPSARRSAR
jgi:peptidoglycan/LPS O-acetylase OafA/YrhL